MSHLFKDKAYIQTNIPVDYTPMQDLSIDIKTMPQAFGVYHLLSLLVI